MKVTSGQHGRFEAVDKWLFLVVDEILKRFFDSFAFCT
jgi:hypothetical protein